MLSRSVLYDADCVRRRRKIAMIICDTNSSSHDEHWTIEGPTDRKSSVEIPRLDCLPTYKCHHNYVSDVAVSRHPFWRLNHKESKFEMTGGSSKER